MKTLLFPALVACSLLAVSCQKDDNPTMRTTYLTNGKWMLHSIMENTGTGDVDITSQASGYIQNRYRFISGGDFIRLRTLQTDSLPIQDSAKSGTWTFKDADTRLLLTDSNLAGDYQVVNATTDQLVLKATTTPPDGGQAMSTTKTMRRVE